MTHPDTRGCYHDELIQVVRVVREDDLEAPVFLLRRCSTHQSSIDAGIDGVRWVNPFASGFNLATL